MERRCAGNVSDARLTGRPYRWNERVSPFFLEADSPENMTAYNGAAVLLRLGLSIASADGQVDPDELTLITDHLEAQFNLTPNQSKRLEQLKYLLLHSREAYTTISTLLKNRLPHAHRLLIGKFLVGIAAADQIVTRDESKALRAAYRALGLELSELDQLLVLHTPDDGKAPVGGEAEPQHFRLDMEAVSNIMAETKEVASILHRVMSEDNGVDETVSGAPSSSEAAWQTGGEAVATATLEPDDTEAEAATEEGVLEVDGLPTRFRPFLRSLIARSRWTHGEAMTLAREHGVMLAGAVEAINEWSCEQHGDWLLEEEDDGLVVQIDLLNNGI